MLLSWIYQKAYGDDDSTTQSDIDLSKIHVAGDRLIAGMRHRIDGKMWLVLILSRLDYGARRT